MLKSTAFATLMASTLLAGPAFAQSASSSTADQDGQAIDREVVIVTAQKREQALQDVPIAITALSAETLETQGIYGLQDLASVPPPGLAVQSFSGANQILILDIRGVSNPDPGQGTVELGTAIYLDDIYLGRAQGLGAELADPERIEVLRGPQGTLFGRNAQGGAVRIVSKKPTGNFEGRGKITAGNYGRQRFETHLDLPEFAGFSLKLDYLINTIDGYTENGPSRVAGLASQDDFGRDESEGYRASVRWEPLSRLVVDYSYDNAESENVADWYVLVAPNPPVASFVLPAAFRDRSRPQESVSERTENTGFAMFNEPFLVDTSGHTLTAAYDPTDSIMLKSLTGWRSTDSVGSQQLGSAFSLVPFATPLPASAFLPDPRFGALGTISPTTPIHAVTGVVPYAELHQEQFSQEFQLLGSFTDFEYVVGLYYFEEQVSDLRQSFFSGMFTDSGADGVYTDFVGTNPFSLPFPGQGLTSQEAASESYAAFAQGTWSPSFADGRLHLTGGLRYTDDSKEARRTLQGGAAVDRRSTFAASRVDPAFTAAYDVAQDINVYFRYAQAYRAGGTSVRDPNFTDFDAEVNKAFELGLKSTLLDRRVTFNAAAFHNDVQSRQITVQTSLTDPTRTRIINAPGSSPVYGLELELTARPMRGLVLGATYVYQQGDLDEAALAEIDPTGDFFIPNLPENSGTFTVDYETAPLAFGTIALHADYSWADSFDGTVRVPKNSFAYSIERDVANARVSLKDIAAGPLDLTVSAFVKNAFDTAYPVFVAAGAPVILSAPRTYGLELGFTF